MRFQEYLLTLRAHGMALAVASKNDPQLVATEFDRIEGMRLALTLTPLAVVGTMLAAHGCLIAVSTTAVDTPPSGWAHYAAAKTAAENLATHFGNTRSIPTLVLRAPKMLTTLADGPTSRLAAVPTEQVAADITRWIITGTAASRNNRNNRP
jgi:nucleoside-diphosphate-sugar epimerase